MALLVLLCLGSPATIRVGVEGGATEVVALRDGVVWARAAVANGVALLEGLPRGRYDVVAAGCAAERGVRAVHDRGPGLDARLVAGETHLVTVRTQPGAIVWVDGVPHPSWELRLPGGLHRLFVDHPQRVSSAGRLVRVAGPLALDIPLEPGLVVTGRVLDGAGAPVVGASVEAYADGIAMSRKSLSDPEGSFGVGGFRGDVVSLRVRAPGYADTMRRVLFFPGQERARIEVRLGPASAVRLPISGAPAADALLLPRWYEDVLEEPRLRANHAPARRRGRSVMFPGLEPGRAYRILVTAQGYVPGSTASFVAPAAGETLALPPVTLVPAASIDGAVVSRGAVHGLTVLCRGPEGELTSRTDRAGRFRFEGLDRGAHTLLVRDRDERGVAVPAGTSGVRLVCGEAPRDRSIRGFVGDADGGPLAGVEVEAAGRTTLSDQEGAFLFERLPLGREQFSVRFRPVPGCRALVEDPHLPHVAVRARLGTTLRVQLQRAGTLRLRLERPLARGRLRIVDEADRARHLRVARGRRLVEVAEVAVESYRVEAAAPGFSGEEARATPRSEVPLKVGRGRRASGKVVHRVHLPKVLDREVSRGWVVLFTYDPLRALATTPVEPDGSFRLSGLPAGKVLLCAASPGYPVTMQVTDLSQGDAAGLVLPLFDAVEAAVRVSGPGGGSVHGARVRVLSAHGLDMRDVAAVGRFRRVVADDGDIAELPRFFRLRRQGKGRISAPFLAPGSYRFVVSAKGYKTARVGVRAGAAGALGPLRKIIPKEIPAAPDLATPVRLVPAQED